MSIFHGFTTTRRSALAYAAELGLWGAGAAYAAGFGLAGKLSAAGTADDYKALVCVFLNGGNDHANTLIPYDPSNYARYETIRGKFDSVTKLGAAIPRNDLRNTVLQPRSGQVLTDGITYALAPTMPKMAARFNEGRLAAILNVGPLAAPITRAQYDSGNRARYPVPAHLFSHNDQQSIWQSSEPEGAKTGWGGRLADLIQHQNANMMFSAINTSGTGHFLRGLQSAPYRVSTRGAPLFSGLKYGQVFQFPKVSQALTHILTASDGHLFKADYTSMNARSIEYGQFVNDALNAANLATDFGNGNTLADQLSIVARLIASRKRLGVKRQVFFVSLGGFDSHSDLVAHQGLLGQVDHALDAFYRATQEIGAADQVTTFTASDFGRTLSINGNGSDHGWGGHHFVLGDSVRGGTFYGVAPHVSVNSDDQVGRGRLLPRISVDEYSATLSRWFGIAASDLPIVHPNIGRFSSPDLGFMLPT